MKVYCQNSIISVHDEDNEIFNICGFMQNHATDSIVFTILVKKDSSIIYSCENFNALFENNLNKKLSEIFNKDVYEDIRKLMLESIFTNKQLLSEIKIDNRFYIVSLFPILDSKLNIRFILINALDSSKDKRFQEEIEELKIKLEESNSIKSIFLSNISHELRTPMNAIIGFSDILLENQNQVQNKEQVERFIKSINSNAKYLDELLNNILDYSKLESKDFDILYENFSIYDLFDELFEIFEDVNYKKNLDFVKLEFIKNEDKKIISDFLRLKQVLFNIISNSIKFTENGKIKISFNIDKEFITFIVEDSGIGIPEEKINFVFDRFWQCDSSSTKKHKGAGLGLSISKSIVEMLNGEIWLQSIVNKGTTFYVKIPLEEIKPEEEISIKNKINFTNKTVLIVDELPTNYSLLGIYLNTLNIKIISASNGQDAIKIFKKQKRKIDLIILDLSLPDISGFDLAKKLKSISSKCKILSKSAKKDTLIGFVDYHLQKPINKDKLLLILNKIWQK